MLFINPRYALSEICWIIYVKKVLVKIIYVASIIKISSGITIKYVEKNVMALDKPISGTPTGMRVGEVKLGKKIA